MDKTKNPIIIILFPIIIIIIILVFLSIQKISTSPDTEIDEVSGKTIINIETGGGVKEDGITVGMIGFNEVYEQNNNTTTNEIIFQSLSHFFSQVYPDIKRISPKNDSITITENSLSFELLSDTKKQFFVFLENNQLYIKDNNNQTIYQYNFSEDIRKKPAYMISNYLPNTLTTDNNSYVIKYNNDSTIQIYLEFCPSNTLKERILQDVKSWVTNLNFNVNSFEYAYSDMCF